MLKDVRLDAFDALILVDMQNDFLPGGALAVPGSHVIVPVLNCYIEYFHSRQRLIVATRDWHPVNHCSFQPQGGPWPEHCVAGTQGAEFSSDLQMPADTWIVSKAEHPETEAYSDFDGTGLHERLQQAGIKRLFVGGLATEYCVLYTVRDALHLGYAVCLLADAVRAIDVNPGDGVKAVAKMHQAGAMSIHVKQLR